MYASYLYDQLWAIVMAVNNSLPVLENRNLSIDNYTIGQREITDVIEQQMSNLSFQDAGGWVEFNQYHSVSILQWKYSGFSKIELKHMLEYLILLTL